MSEAASYRLIVDGYNVVGPVAAPRGRPIGWLAREREQLLVQMAKGLPAKIGQRTCVVFDAKDAPPDLPATFVRYGVTVRFAREVAEADDLIEALIRQNSSPKRLTVVSSDRRLQVAGKRRGCLVMDSEDFLDALLDGRLGRKLAGGTADRTSSKLDAPLEASGRGSGDGSEPEPELDAEELRRLMGKPHEIDSIVADDGAAASDAEQAAAEEDIAQESTRHESALKETPPEEAGSKDHEPLTTDQWLEEFGL